MKNRGRNGLDVLQTNIILKMDRDISVETIVR